MLRSLAAAIALGAALSAASSAWGEARTLRFASIVPEGTSWARTLKSFARDVNAATNGQVSIKWVLGGIAGDELTALERVRHGQLDGMSGAFFCMRLAPSMRVARIIGLFRNRAEVSHVLSRLRPTLDEEFRRSGFTAISVSVTGVAIIFSQKPVRSLTDLRHGTTWMFDQDEVWALELPELGLRTVPLPVEQVARALDEGRVDIVVGAPSSALAYQWAPRVKYFSDLEVALLPSCAVIANRAIDELPLEHQQALRFAATKATGVYNELGEREDAQLLGGLFERQGMTRVPADAAFRGEFFDAAQTVRNRLGGKLVPQALMQRVLGMLADFRAEQRPAQGRR
jgi:TRAP-type C4-dicarboxylate transport system substrate-binding protein